MPNSYYKTIKYIYIRIINKDFFTQWYYWYQDIYFFTLFNQLKFKAIQEYMRIQTVTNANQLGGGGGVGVTGAGM